MRRLQNLDYEHARLRRYGALSEGPPLHSLLHASVLRVVVRMTTSRSGPSTAVNTASPQALRGGQQALKAQRFGGLR